MCLSLPPKIADITGIASISWSSQAVSINNGTNVRFLYSSANCAPCRISLTVFSIQWKPRPVWAQTEVFQGGGFFLNNSKD